MPSGSRLVITTRSPATLARVSSTTRSDRFSTRCWRCPRRGGPDPRWVRRAEAVDRVDDVLDGISQVVVSPPERVEEGGSDVVVVRDRCQLYPSRRSVEERASLKRQSCFPHPPGPYEVTTWFACRRAARRAPRRGRRTWVRGAGRGRVWPDWRTLPTSGQRHGVLAAGGLRRREERTEQLGDVGGEHSWVAGPELLDVGAVAVEGCAPGRSDQGPGHRPRRRRAPRCRTRGPPSPRPRGGPRSHGRRWRRRRSARDGRCRRRSRNHHSSMARTWSRPRSSRSGPAPMSLTQATSLASVASGASRSPSSHSVWNS